jgi:hypothetical protein
MLSLLTFTAMSATLDKYIKSCSSPVGEQYLDTSISLD